MKVRYLGPSFLRCSDCFYVFCILQICILYNGTFFKSDFEFGMEISFVYLTAHFDTIGLVLQVQRLKIVQIWSTPENNIYLLQWRKEDRNVTSLSE